MYTTWKTVKGSAIANHLAKITNDNYESLRFDFPNKDVMTLLEESRDDEFEGKWKIYFDRVVNLLGNRVGAMIVSPEEK